MKAWRLSEYFIKCIYGYQTLVGEVLRCCCSGLPVADASSPPSSSHGLSLARLRRTVIHASGRQEDAESFPDLLPGYSYATRQKPRDFNLRESNLNPNSILFLVSAALQTKGRGPASCKQNTEDLLLPMKKIFAFGVGQVLWEKVFFPSALRLWLHLAQLLLLYLLTENLQPLSACLLQSRCDQKQSTTLKTRGRSHARVPCTQRQHGLPGGRGGGTALEHASTAARPWAPPACVSELLAVGRERPSS